MDREEYKARAEEIRALVGENRLTEAMEIADTIDWHRVRGEKMLCLVSDLYKYHRRYEESLDVLMMAYKRNPASSEMVRSLCELSTKLNDTLGAVEYLKEFIRLAPSDARRYLLQYRLYEAQDVSLEERIAVLEEYKKHEYKPRWAYELAYLYHRVGLATECVTQCDEMASWFGKGLYVVKALELKSLHAALTQEQQEILDREKQAKSAPQAQYSRLDTDAAPTIRIPQNRLNAAQKPEKEVAKNMEQTKILVPTMDVNNQYSTMNLQEALAEGVKELLGTPEEPARQTTDVKPRAGSPRAADAQYERMLGEETDGQISMVVEAPGTVERQITGQISIDDIMDRIRNEQQKRQEQRVQQIVEVRTLGMFHSFDEETKKDGTLVAAEEAAPEQTEAGAKHTVVRPDEGVRPYVATAGQPAPANALEALMQVQQAKKEEEEETKASGLKSWEADAKVWEDDTQEDTQEEASKEAAVEEEPVKETKEETEEEPAKETKEETEEEPEKETKEETEEEPEKETKEETEEEPAKETKEETGEEPVKETQTEEASETEAANDKARAGKETGAKETATEEIVEKETSGEEAPAAKETAKEEAAEKAPATKERTEEEKRPVERRIAAMSEKEKALYGSFLHNKDTCNQIVMAIDRLNVNSGFDNAVVTGKDNEQTLNLARGLIRSVASANPEFSGKIAKIKGDAFAAAKVESSLEKLENGALIITGAARMGRDLKIALAKALSDGTHHLLVILIDSEKHMHDLLNRNQELQKLFNIVINAERLNDDGLVAFGREYAREKEFSIDNLGLLALHTRIESLQTYDHMVSTEEVMEIVDEAIANASKKNLSHFADVLFRKRFDDEDMIILREKDFLP